MSDFDWKDIVGTVAPTLATALGGPLAGAATKVIAQKWLGKEDATEEEVAAALAGATPADLLRLKKVDQDFQRDMFKLEVADRNSARKMFQVDKTPQVGLSVVFIVAYSGVLYLHLTGGVNIPPGQEAVANTIIGVLTAGVIKILDFWFGSSSGSKDKSLLLALAERVQSQR